MLSCHFPSFSAELVYAVLEPTDPLLFLLFSDTSTMNRITAVEKETERPVGTSTAIVPNFGHYRRRCTYWSLCFFLDGSDTIHCGGVRKE
jgi:hypothetical protein